MAQNFDLLTLIGHAIEELQQSIELLEGAQRPDGVNHLCSVIDEIDVYLDRIDEDPLLKLAPLAPSHIRLGLHHVREDLSSVIDDLQQQAG